MHLRTVSCSCPLKGRKSESMIAYSLIAFHSAIESIQLLSDKDHGLLRDVCCQIFLYTSLQDTAVCRGPFIYY